MQSRKSPAGGRSQLSADPKHTDPGGFATRKRMLTLDYLTSQSENHSWAASPSLSLKSVLSLEHELPLLLAQPCKTSCTFLHHHPLSGDWLYCPRVRGPRFASVTTYLVRESGSERFKSFFKAHTKLVLEAKLEPPVSEGSETGCHIAHHAAFLLWKVFRPKSLTPRCQGKLDLSYHIDIRVNALPGFPWWSSD